MGKKKANRSGETAVVHMDLIDPEFVIGLTKESDISDEGEKFESEVLLCLTKTHVELFQFATWKRKSKAGDWQTKPSSELRDRQRVKIEHIKSMATLKNGKQRTLRIRSDRRVMIDESNKNGRTPWENSKERAFCIEFEASLSSISDCRKRINAAIKNRKS